MISNYNALKKYIFRLLRKIIRILFDFLPIKINQFFAKKGYTYLTSRKKKFEFETNIYGTKLFIKADSQSNIDRVATSNKFINDDFRQEVSASGYGMDGNGNRIRKWELEFNKVTGAFKFIETKFPSWEIDVLSFICTPTEPLLE